MRILPTLLLMLALIPSGAAFSSEPIVIHVLVALCDNVNQGIVPVSAFLGNGDDPANNLYWGAMYGVSTHFKKHKGWRLESRIIKPTAEILERLVFSSTAGDAWLIADAYAGKHIKLTTEDLFNFAAGQTTVAVALEGQELTAGGGADLLVYMGHNGLMDFYLDGYPVAVDGDTNFMKMPENGRPIFYDGKKREVAVFSCHSESYFKGPITRTGANPLILTRDFMAPEAYILAALADGWLAGQTPAEIRDRVADAYNKYQKCGQKAARRTFTAGP